jgi:hypothetical protein
METQYLRLFSYYVAFVAGIAGGCFSHKFRPSGKRALAISLVPLVLSVAPPLAVLFAESRGIDGVRELFC